MRWSPSAFENEAVGVFEAEAMPAGQSPGQPRSAARDTRSLSHSSLCQHSFRYDNQILSWGWKAFPGKDRSAAS